ncbi:hypothetical protein PIB30_038240 [Stylosanthes scabra]|uniref:Protein FAR1-RELATED SEQUENCE n=1 Tax=Stylosanthes scabra TaxID=79078 RepID=A0ABU6UH60_9FABA|nr:hypothetical protein [Stylosanthes scabra]
MVEGSSNPQDLNSNHELEQLDEQMEFACNVDEEYIPKVEMTFVKCAKANEFYKKTSDIPEAEKTNPMSPANCSARIYIHIQKKTQLYVISKVILQHSHPCSADLAEMLPQHRENTAGGHHGLNFIEKDVRNYITREACNVSEEEDAKELGKYFLRMKESNPNFFYELILDDDKGIKNAF